MTPISRQEAKAQGLKHYLPAKPCKRGHLSPRFVSTGNCGQCLAEYKQTAEAKAQQAKYRHDNAEQIAKRSQVPERKAQRAKYRHDNAEKIAAQSAEYYKLNPEKLKAQTAVYRKTNPEKVAAQNAAYRKLNPEKIAARNAAYYKLNSEKIAAQNAAYQKAKRPVMNAIAAARRAAKLQATPSWADTAAIKAIYEQCTERTKATGIPHAVDHVYPLQGLHVSGLHVAANLQILTKSENSRKKNRTPTPEQIPSDLE